jgi:hypothetical protein
VVCLLRRCSKKTKALKAKSKSRINCVRLFHFLG